MVTSSSRKWRQRMMFGVLCAAAGVGCTLLGNRDLSQCNVDADCKGAVVGRNAICVDHLCAPGPEAGAPDAPPPPDTGADAPPVQCVTTKDCPRDKDFLCVKNTCTVITDQQCDRLISPNGEHREDGTLIFGVYVFGAANGPATAVVEAAVNAIDSSPLKRPKVAALMCEKGKIRKNDSAALTFARLSALQIPLVIGQFEASELNVPSGDVAVWSTLSTLEPSTAIADGGGTGQRFLVDELQSLSPAFGPAFDRAVERADTLYGGGGPLGASLKVAVVRTDRNETKLLGNKVLAANPAGDAAVSITNMPSLFDTTGIALDVTGTVNQLKTELPHIVVAIGGDEVFETLHLLEDALATAGLPRPIWILVTPFKSNASPMQNFVTKYPGLRARIIGVDFDGDAAKLKTLAAGRAPETIAFGPLYDAVYVATMSAMYVNARRASDALPFTGIELTTALNGVLEPDGGVPVDGAESFKQGVFDEIILGKRTVSFTGVSGPWTFPGPDPRFRRMKQSYFCYEANKQVPTAYFDSSALTGPCVVP